MNDTNIKKDINSVIINIETPHDDTNTSLQELERDNWGRILNNQTFTKMKDNFRLIKKAVSNFLTEVVNDLKVDNTANGKEVLYLSNEDTVISCGDSFIYRI